MKDFGTMTIFDQRKKIDISILDMLLLDTGNGKTKYQPQASFARGTSAVFLLAALDSKMIGDYNDKRKGGMRLGGFLRQCDGKPSRGDDGSCFYRAFFQCVGACVPSGTGLVE